MITFWKLPGMNSMKVALPGKPITYVSISHANIALTIAEKLGYKVVDHGHKITVEQEA